MEFEVKGKPKASTQSKERGVGKRTRARKKKKASGALGGGESGSPDVIRMYLDEIGRFRRLTREEEVSLSKRALEDDKDAQDMLVNHNLRLVVSIAKGFVRGRMKMMDLVSVGNEGLMVASRKYDGTTGVPFANYAAFWIKQRILKYLAEHGSVVRVPPYRSAVVNKVVKAERELRKQNGKEPSEEEVSERSGLSVDEVTEVLQLMQPAMDLDAPVSEEDGTATMGSYFGESFEEAEERVEDSLADMDRKNSVQQALECLPPRDAQVLIWCFGLNGRRALDLDQIGERLGVTRERARQLRSKALKRLREETHLESLLPE